MSRRRTKPEEIRNSEHYFNRYIAKEVQHDEAETTAYQNIHKSFEAILMGEDPDISRRKLLRIAGNEDEYLISRHQHSSVEDWLIDIENPTLHKALIKLTERQQLILLYRYDYLLSQKDVAAMLHISQQAVSKQERSAKNFLKKFLSGGCEKR